MLIAEKHTEKCRSCREKIIWLRHKTTGRMAPIEAREVEGGNIEINLVARTYDIKNPAPGLHLNHFATCKQAKQWRGQ
jgi:hypothetical protein